jgi:hypothetical protein
MGISSALTTHTTMGKVMSGIIKHSETILLVLGAWETSMMMSAFSFSCQVSDLGKIQPQGKILI